MDSEQGVIDNFIANELNVNAEWSAFSKNNAANVRNFISKAKDIIKRDPDVKDETLIVIAFGLV